MLPYRPDITFPHGVAHRHLSFLRQLDADFELRTIVCEPWENRLLPPDAVPARALPGGDRRVEFPSRYSMPALGRRVDTVSHYLRPGPPMHSRLFARALLPLIQDMRPDLVVLVGIHLSYLATLLSDTPSLAVIEEDPYRIPLNDPPNRREAVWRQVEAAKRRWLFGELSRRRVPVVVMCDEERRALSQLLPIERLHVVPHGVDGEYFRPDHCPAHRCDVAMVARLDRQRNADAALALFSDLLPGHRLELTAAGVLPMPRLERLRNHGVDVPGYLADVRPVYAGASVVVVPALANTGVKTGVLEAWAMGRPVVVSPACTVGLPVVHGENALIGSDFAEMTRHVQTLLGSTASREQLASAGRAMATQLGLDRGARAFSDLSVHTARVG